MDKIKDIRDKAFSLTSKIIKETGPRLAGTEASIEAAHLLKASLKGFVDKVELEEFIVHKGAFLDWIRILVICYFLGIVFLWLQLPIVSALLTIISLLILVFQFFFYKHMLDPFFPKRKGVNVVGNIEPVKEAKRQIIISGHHDSARVFNFLIHQPKLYNLRVSGGILVIVAFLLISIVLIFLPAGIIATVLKAIASAGFLLTGQLWFFASKEGSPGAGDNLIASAMALEIGRYFSENKLNHTRIIVVSFDAEEEGLRGASAYAKKHEDDFKKTPTYLLNADCLYFFKDLFFLTSDINCTVALSNELAEDLVAIAKKKNYPAVCKPIAFLAGGTDAGELAKKGVKATTLLAMPWSNEERANVYHTPYDTIDNIEKAAIDASIDIFITYIEENDNKTN